MENKRGALRPSVRQLGRRFAETKKGALRPFVGIEYLRIFLSDFTR
jgi:hypothetical protein